MTIKTTAKSIDELSQEEIKELARAKKNEYQRKWHQAHPGKAQEYQDRHFAKKYLEEQAEQTDTNE